MPKEPLQGMSWDQQQELKEAVCDAVLGRTRRVVSGDGIHGAAVLADKPSRFLSSGFILPRLNEDGDDESSDIRIASHGMDIRIRASDIGAVRIRPSFHVYVRALPTSQDLFARNGRLIPKADFNDGAKDQKNAEIRRRATAEIPAGTNSRQRALLKAAISKQVLVAMGVGVPADADLPADDRDETAIDETTPQEPTDGGRLRIPDHLSRRYDIPKKWLKIEVDAPVLELPLPCEAGRWEAEASAYNIRLVQAVRDACVRWVNSANGQEHAWRKVRPQSEAFWGPLSWDQFLIGVRATLPNPADLIPEFEIQVLVQPLPDPLEPSTYSVRVALENLRETDTAKELGLYGVSLSVEVPERALGPMRLERVRRSYHLAGFMTMPAIGVNAGVINHGVVDGTCRLQSTWMPRYVLPRIQATEIPSVPTAYSKLAAAETPVAMLFALPDAMEAWVNSVAQNTRLSEPGEEGTDADEAAQRVRFEDDLQAWRREQARIRSGVTLLVRAQEAWRVAPNTSAAAPYRAWLLLNRTFSMANPSRPGQRPPGWRLFQLAFVLSHVPTFASRLPEYSDCFDATFDEDSASLLYMSTGGGKTEAFFGTIVFALFLDRLRGKTRGVTAMMHYPLRLLTVQQAQRLALLLAQAEMVRRRETVAGSAFEIGFWVGNNNTPNSTERKAGQLEDALKCIPAWSHPRARDENALLNSAERQDREYVIAKEAWNKIPDCPFCRSQGSTALRLYPERHNRLGIVCLSVQCEWNKEHPPIEGQAPEPLPFLLVDTDIYRRAPAVLLGTIDKLALLGQNITTIDRIAGMFGMARTIEGGADGFLQMIDRPVANEALADGTQHVAPSYADGVEVFFDPFPSIIIQDEMHLLEESLDTFGGIFETGLFTWLTKLAELLEGRVCRIPGAPDRPRLPHIIGATATAADVARHIRSLYQKQVVQFPHPGPSLHEGFYTRVAAFEDGGVAAGIRASQARTPRERETGAPWGRVYASIMTNGRLHTVTTLSVLAAHAATITRWQRDLASGDASRRSRVGSEMIDCVSDAAWSDRRLDAIRSVITAGRFEDLAHVLDLHRIQLTYVTNKKGGDQILSALNGEVREAHAAMGREYELNDYRMELISGGVDIGGIQRVIREAEEKFDPMVEDISGCLRGIVATSAISHGVDVEEFNSMAFAGMPPDIAEYIQASSRVGRMHVGFSLLVPTPQTRRDRFVVEVHESFHRLLERMISPAAAERWADRAIQRTIPSLVQMWLGGVRHQERFVRSQRKAEVKLPTTVEQVERLLRDQAALDDCVEFVAEAIGIGAATGAPTNPGYYEGLTRAYISKIRSCVLSGEFVGPLRDFWDSHYTGLQRPMTSLRDVDAAGRIRASNRTQRNQTLRREAVGEAMAVLRNRGVSRRRRSAGSELDGDF